MSSIFAGTIRGIGTPDRKFAFGYEPDLKGFQSETKATDQRLIDAWIPESPTADIAANSHDATADRESTRKPPATEFESLANADGDRQLQAAAEGKMRTGGAWLRTQARRGNAQPALVVGQKPAHPTKTTPAFTQQPVPLSETAPVVVKRR
jgi:hypothetical protein